ncbi:MAG: SDR family oxidoreductase [Alphaproteobacteria bacterium]
MESFSETSPLTRTANAGKVALVTGGGTGVGRATALELGRTGAKVVICGRRAAPIDATRDALQSAGIEALSVTTDIREPDQVDRLLDAALDRFGRIDILVNNAGGQFMAPAEEISLKGWRAVHRVSADAVWDITQKVALRSMIPNRSGVIVFIGFSPRVGTLGLSQATAARAAVESLAPALAMEWTRFGIRAVCVSPGHIDSEGMQANYDKALQAEWQQQVPMKRFGRPSECATVIAFLTSSGASYVTGTTVIVDGGAGAWGISVMPPDLVPPGETPPPVPWAAAPRK